MREKIYILGGAQTDFAVNYHRQDKAIFDLFKEVTETALNSARVEPSQVEVAHVGNFAAELFTGQGQLGGFLGHVHPDLDGIPTSRHEGACASGSLAILAATADIAAGRYGMALVIGIELMRNVPGQKAAENLGSAAWVGMEAQGATYVWPAMFSQLLDEYDRRYGVDMAHLRAISANNFSNARKNPNAQTRGWQIDDAYLSDNDEANPLIEGRLRKSDCGQVTDGAAAILLASAEVAARYAKLHGLDLDDLPYIKGWGHTTAPMLLTRKVSDSADQPYVFPHTRKAMMQALERAGMQDVYALDGLEVHDCFSVTEYMILDHFGVTPPGESWRAVEDGTIGMGGRLPVNPSGGLIGLGHPVGATGVRMVLDCARQVTGTADELQIDGARNFGTFNLGGSATTAVSFIVGR